MITMLRAAVALLAALLLWSAPVRADFNFTEGSGETAFSITTGTAACSGVHCFASVPINTAGAPLFVGGNAGLVTGTGGTFPSTITSPLGTGTAAADSVAVVVQGGSGLNANGQATMANSAPMVIASNQSAIPVINGGSTYETVAASQTGQVLGTTGAIGDYLSHCVIYPTSTTPGVVTVFDDASAAGTNVIAFPGGASSVSNLAPIAIPVGAVSVAGEWRVTTGANLVVTCYGRFT